MDGLSAGASVIAVISLVVQLGGAAHDLVKFLETMSDAPSEIKRLRDLLGMVFALSTGVRNVLEGQRRLHGDSVPVEEAIHTALVNCQRTICQIQDLVNKMDKVDSGRHMVSRSWARLRIALKKDEVVELETQLGQGLQMLNLTLTMNLMVSNTKSTTLLVDKIDGRNSTSLGVTYQNPSSSTKLLEAPLPVDAPRKLRYNYPCPNEDENIEHSAGDRPSISWRQKQTIISKESSGWSLALTPLGSLSIRTTQIRMRKNCGDTQSDVDTETTTSYYTIRPTFLLKSLQLVIQRSGNTSAPRTSLYIRRVIPLDISQQVIRCSKDDDLHTFQQMLTSGEITIDCMDSYGFTLLWWLISFPVSKILSFLQKQGYQSTETELALFSISLLSDQANFNDCTLFPCIRLWVKFHASSDTWAVEPHRLFVLPSQLLTGEHLYSHHIGLLPYILDVIDYFMSNLHQSLLPEAEYLGSLLMIMAQSWHFPATAPISHRKKVLARMLIARGANLCFRETTFRFNQLARGDFLTILQVIVALATPQEQSQVVSEWLDLVESCNVDLRVYISAEFSISSQAFLPMRMWQAEEGGGIVYQSGGLISIDVSHDSQERPRLLITRRLADHTSPAALVLGEFRFPTDFRLKFPGRDGTCGRGIPNSCVVTKHKFLSSPNERDDPEDEARAAADIGLDRIREATAFCNFDELWPFHQALHTLCYSHYLSYCPLFTRELCAVHCCQFNQERFERKQAKKTEKTLKLQGRKIKTIPGAWVE